MDNEESHRWQKKWTMFNQLDDLDFADNIALLSHSHQQMQE
jgi:hypothetical protein